MSHGMAVGLVQPLDKIVVRSSHDLSLVVRPIILDTRQRYHPLFQVLIFRIGF